MVAIRFSSVDFPDPDAPIIPQKAPFGRRKLTSSTARTAASPAPYSLVTRTSSKAFPIASSSELV